VSASCERVWLNGNFKPSLPAASLRSTAYTSKGATEGATAVHCIALPTAAEKIALVGRLPVGVSPIRLARPGRQVTVGPSLTLWQDR
jgi:hypothetical protein